MNKHKDIVWTDRKRNFLGLPWTFTRYQLSDNRLFIETGLLNSREAEIRLYRVTDMTLTRNLWQKIIGTGTIHCDSADPTMKNFDIKNIKNPFDTKEQLSDLVEKNRRENHVYMRENMMTGGHGPDMDIDPGEMFDHDMDCDGNH